VYESLEQTPLRTEENPLVHVDGTQNVINHPSNQDVALADSTQSSEPAHFHTDWYARLDST